MIDSKVQYILYRARWVPVILCIIPLFMLLRFLLQSSDSTPAESPGPESPLPMLPVPPEHDPSIWSVYRSINSAASAEAGPLSQRFRLAGTFFSYGSIIEGEERNLRKAILDDLQRNEQFMVKENEEVDGVLVVHIFHDRIRLRANGEDEELALSFATANEKKAEPTAGGAIKTYDEAPVLEENRFGKRIADNRWVLSRKALLEYHQEILDDPERIADIYLSFQPQENEEGPSGYSFDFEGEEEFFKGLGFKNGDTIRRVNSMRMTSQLRGEYLLKEFLRDRLNAFVFDIERDGKEEKIIHMIR